MARSDANLIVSIDLGSSFREMELGFLQGANPQAFKRLQSMAVLNAAKTMVGPMKAAAPVRTGRLKNSVKARRGRYSTPSGVVGPTAGRSRGARGGAWYRWFVTSGTSGVRQTKMGAIAVKPVRPRPFVMKVAKDQTNSDRALESYSATIAAFFNNEAFRNTIIKWKRGKR
jgi:hypothetical protein